MANNVYRGRRYVPKIMGTWDNTKQTPYEPLSIVEWGECSYTSKIDVPVGVDILNTKYWVCTGNYNAQVELYRREAREFDGRITQAENDINLTNEELNKKQNSEDEKLITSEKNIVGAINENKNEINKRQLMIDNELKTNNKKIALAINEVLQFTNDIGLDARWFGVKTDEYESGYNSTLNIIAALEYAKENKISNILLPYGTINISPINFVGYRQLTIKGCSAKYYPDINEMLGTTLKIVENGDVGLQFSDVSSPKTYPSSASCKLENLKLDCNNKVRCGINGNFDFAMDNVYVVNSIQDGIILEDYSYPVKLKNVFAAYNGRHGIYVKGANTTVYSMADCEFSRNEGYGMYIENGAHCQFDNCMVQSNKRGGLKIMKNNIDGVNNNYLFNLKFNSFYTEGNGLLEPTNEKFEGNYAIFITSNKIDSNNNNKANRVEFNNSSINPSTKGREMKIDCVYGFYLNNTIIAFNKTDIPTPEYCSSMYVNHGANYVDIGGYAPFPFISSYGQNDGETSFLMYRGGIMGDRGRTMMMCFYVDDIASGTTINMETLLSGKVSGSLKGYPLFGTSSILGVTLSKRTSAYNDSSVFSGSLSAEIVVYNTESGANPSQSVGIPPIVIDIGSKVTPSFKTVKYPVQKYTIKSNSYPQKTIGIKLSSSPNYSNGRVDDKGVFVYVLLEC